MTAYIVYTAYAKQAIEICIAGCLAPTSRIERVSKVPGYSNAAPLLVKDNSQLAAATAVIYDNDRCDSVLYSELLQNRVSGIRN